MSEHISKLEPKCFWMGGGNTDTKMRIGYDEFVSKSEYQIIQGDVTTP